MFSWLCIWGSRPSWSISFTAKCIVWVYLLQWEHLTNLVTLLEVQGSPPYSGTISTLVLQCLKPRLISFYGKHLGMRLRCLGSLIPRPVHVAWEWDFHDERFHWYILCLLQCLSELWSLGCLLLVVCRLKKWTSPFPAPVSAPILSQPFIVSCKL